MPTYRFIQLDVFTDEPFAGNSLAVFPEAEGITDEQMLKIAREMRTSETMIVNLSGRGDKDINTVQEEQRRKHDR